MIYSKYGHEFVARKRRTRYGIFAAVVFFIIVVVYLIGHTIAYKEQHATPMLKSHKTLTDEQWRLSMYFAKNGSPTPEQMAIAVTKTKSPRLLAAIAKIETNGNPHKRNTGYKKRHSGAWQVNPRDWGKVSKDPVEQALQAEFALDTFTKESKGKIKKALNNYGGDSTDKYSAMVLAELERVP